MKTTDYPTHLVSFFPDPKELTLLTILLDPQHTEVDLLKHVHVVCYDFVL